MPPTLDLNMDAPTLLARLIERGPARLGGVPASRGTCVPVRSLFDHLPSGDSLEASLDDFPGGTREPAQEATDLAVQLSGDHSGGRQVIAQQRLAQDEE
jgi:uncharacterized protein (DUF433 family)